MKIKRQSKIIELIQNNEIETQEVLCELLRKAGFEATQATISRDMRELKLTKIAKDGGGHKYAMLSSVISQFSERFLRIYREGVAGMDYAGNLIVVSTLEGMAMAVAACIDAFGFWEILGCIAGDDTIFVAVRSEEAATAVMERFKEMMEG